jgi:hypothetical protein
MVTGRKGHRWMPALALLLGPAWVVTARAQIPKPVVGASEAPAPQAAGHTGVWLPVFQFRDGFWVNLHHFLYLQARFQQQLPVASGEPSPAERAPEDLSKAAPAERQAWQDAVDYYGKNFANYDLAFDSFLARVNDRLGELGTCPDLSGRTIASCNAGLSAELTAVLEEAAPIYRAHWWPQQDQANQVWIAATEPLVRQYGGKLAETLVRVYRAGWPTAPILVDVTDYAGPFGAYTSLDPFHVIVSSTDPRNQAPASFEAVFDQSSRSLALGIEQAIVDQCRRQTKPIPRDLWQALVFYTTGEVMESGSGGPPGYTASSNRDQSYITARGWQGYQRLLKRYWQPYLNGKADMQTAIAELVTAL